MDDEAPRPKAQRANIPLSKQTDPRSFPDYEFREYPKLMTDENGDPCVRNPIYLMTSPPLNSAVEPRPVVRNGKKVLLGGDFVIVKNREEEEAFLKSAPPPAGKISINPKDLIQPEAASAKKAQPVAPAAAAKPQSLEEFASE